MAIEKSDIPQIVDAVKAAMMPSIAQLFEHYSTKTDARFKSLETAFKSQEARLKAHDLRFDRLDHKIESEIGSLHKKIDSEIGGLHKKIDSEVEGLHKKIDSEVGGLNKKIDSGIRGVKVLMEQMDRKIDLAIDLASNSNEGQAKIKNHESRILKLETSMTLVKKTIKSQ